MHRCPWRGRRRGRGHHATRGRREDRREQDQCRERTCGEQNAGGHAVAGVPDRHQAPKSPRERGGVVKCAGGEDRGRPAWRGERFGAAEQRVDVGGHISGRGPIVACHLACFVQAAHRRVERRAPPEDREQQALDQQGLEVAPFDVRELVGDDVAHLRWIRFANEAFREHDAGAREPERHGHGDALADEHRDSGRHACRHGRMRDRESPRRAQNAADGGPREAQSQQPPRSPREPEQHEHAGERTSEWRRGKRTRAIPQCAYRGHHVRERLRDECAASRGSGHVARATGVRARARGPRAGGMSRAVRVRPRIACPGFRTRVFGQGSARELSRESLRPDLRCESRERQKRHAGHGCGPDPDALCRRPAKAHAGDRRGRATEHGPLPQVMRCKHQPGVDCGHQDFASLRFRARVISARSAFSAPGSSASSSSRWRASAAGEPSKNRPSTCWSA